MEGSRLHGIRCVAGRQSVGAVEGRDRPILCSGACGRRQNRYDRLAWPDVFCRPGEFEMTAAASVRVRGVVQGVGFRPFVFRLAKAHALNGWVSNEAAGVTMHLEGEVYEIDAFVAQLKRQPPAAA